MADVADHGFGLAGGGNGFSHTANDTPDTVSQNSLHQVFEARKASILEIEAMARQ
ncbi:MAG: hypothetical protein JJT88_00430 [Gammaproteobacteria bacterium]|nr:hypothetical protein [Gammaproteobacteria bacterium]